MAKSKRARKAQKAQQRNAKQRQAQQFQQVQQSNKNKQVQELRTKYQRVIEQNKTPKVVPKPVSEPELKSGTKSGAQSAAKTASQTTPKPDMAAVAKTVAETNAKLNSVKTTAKADVAKADNLKAAAASTTKSSTTRLRSFAEPRILEKTEISAKTPTLEDWQAKQRQRIEEAYERKQEELKLKEVEFELQAEPKKNIWRKVLATCAILLVIANVGLGGWILAQNWLPRGEVDVPHVGSTSTDQTIDFNQRILAEDGSEFVPVYRLGTAQNLVLKFPDLQCAANCENIQDVMLDEYFLSKDEHSVLNDDGATIVLDSNFLESLAPNNYTLTFEVNNGGDVKLVGVVLTIEKVELVCAEGQVLQGESCVDEAGNEVAKPTERIINYTKNATVTNPNSSQTSNDNNNQSTDNTSSQPDAPETPTTPEKSPEQIACERQIGPTSLTIVHWLSDEEKAEHPNAEVYVMRGSFSIDPQTGAAKMIWVNGVCRPAVSQSSYNGAGSYISSYRAQAIYGGAVSETITNNPGQDVAIWGWKYGRTTIDSLPDSRVVLGY